MKHYDYIFTGAGLAALMTVYQMVKSGKFADKSILLLDQNPKQTNDRTWSFWEKEKGNWDKIVFQKWNLALFKNEKWERVLDLNPYQYKTIRGLDFYNKIFKRISKESNIAFLNQKVLGYSESSDGVVIQTENETFSCHKLFNSIYNPKNVSKQSSYPILQQHFIGWFIKSDTESFNPNVATFMDFSIEQNGNTRFMYVLPTSNTEALIEYTLFSETLLPEQEYEDAIEVYIKNLGITNYKIVDKERGCIPMTSFKFWKNNTKNILNIGSSGGWTKGSTGYTFRNSDKKSKALVQWLQTENDFRTFHKRDKFWFYDLLFLDVLYRRNEVGAKVFSALFKSGNPTLIFKFLDEETTLWEDLHIIWKCPQLTFFSALLRRIFRVV